MKLSDRRARVLDPLERFSEIVFGLIMVLSFTCALSVADAGRDDVREMFVGAIGCNLAWGIIDAAFYLIACLAEAGRDANLLRSVQSSDGIKSREIVAEMLPAQIAAALQPADFDRICAHLSQHTPPPARARLTAENWRGAIGVFLLVFASTFPVVLPFFFLDDVQLALRLSNGIAIALLFGAGYMLAGYAALSRIRTGFGMVAIGVALVALTIALGG